jgi:hypothetical protein
VHYSLRAIAGREKQGETNVQKYDLPLPISNRTDYIQIINRSEKKTNNDNRQHERTLYAT